ncbi:MAG: hypothetical protein WC862_02650 [Patescibacteria group bacterium]
MKSRVLLLGISLLGAGALFIYFGLHHIFIFKKPATLSDTAAIAPTSETLESRFDYQGEVTVEVRPIKIEPNAPWQFEASFDTHSMELDDDLTEQSVLADDQSNYFPPINWTGDEPGGHHRSGILIFDPIDPMPKQIELKIKDVGDISERLFVWDLK